LDNEVFNKHLSSTYYSIVKSRYLKYLNKGLNKELKYLSLLIQLFFFTTVINTPHVC